MDSGSQIPDTPASEIRSEMTKDTRSRKQCDPCFGESIPKGNRHGPKVVLIRSYDSISRSAIATSAGSAPPEVATASCAAMAPRGSLSRSAGRYRSIS
jgi:hypothetical protein